MRRIRSAVADGIRVIVCLEFSAAAPFDEVQDLRRALLAREEVLHAVDSSGAFDLMVECRLDDLAAYQALMDSFASQARPLLERFEASFVCRRYVRQLAESEHALWVPCVNGQQRLAISRIDKVCAEGDYVRVHAADADWLVPSTMSQLEDQLGHDHFIRLHRSLLVRIDAIDRLVHDHRSWNAVLADGSAHRIARARCAAVLTAIREESSTPQHRWATAAHSGERRVEFEENALL
jgi:DNA-binding LytR/AlgR family response regulator